MGLLPSPKLFGLSNTVSFRIFIGIFLICGVMYVLLSSFSPSTLQRIIVELSSQSDQANMMKKINSTLFISNQTQTTNFSVTIHNFSYICDNETRNESHKSISILSFQEHRSQALRPYCDILPTPRNKWIPASRYTESDVVFIIYTGAMFYQNRATAVRDTWLSRVSHKYFFSSTPYQPLPVTVIEGAGEGYASNMKKLYEGMRVAYRKHNGTAKFYFLAGCDTFINVPHLLKRLDRFDYSQPYVIGGHPFGYSCYRNKNITHGSVTYPSGGAGFFLSAAMMTKMYPKLSPYFEHEWPTQNIPYSDGTRATLLPGFWAFTPEETVKRDGKAKLRAEPEPNTFHYVKPTSMYILDEFYVFQYIDRLANDKNLDELVKFARQFVAVHYELLRIKQKECTLPPVSLKPT